MFFSLFTIELLLTIIPTDFMWKQVVTAPFNETCHDGCSMKATILHVFCTYAGFPALVVSAFGIILVTTALTNDFVELNKDFKSNLNNNCLDIESIRQRHMELGKIVRAADNIISCPVLIFLSWMVLNTCSFIYALLMHNNEMAATTEGKIGITIFVACVFAMFTLVSVSTNLNDKVRKYNEIH